MKYRLRELRLIVMGRGLCRCDSVEPGPRPACRNDKAGWLTRLHLKFWSEELPIRLRSWWARHWWPARIRQLQRENDDWQRWLHQTEEAHARCEWEHA